MAPVKCCYFRCSNTSAQKSMFRFPCNQVERTKIWLTNCGNMTISHLPIDELRNRFICIDHFDRQYVRNESGQRKRLLKTAVPQPYQAPENINTSPPQSCPASPQELKVLTPKKVYGRMSSHHDTPDYLSDKENFTWSTPRKRKRQDHDIDTPKCKRLKTILGQTSKKLKREESKNQRLKNMIIDHSNYVDLSKHKFKSKSSELLTRMQLRKSKKSWTDDEKKFCMSLYYKSPSAYKFMIDSGIILAAPSTIQRWLQETDCLPGLNDDIFESIKMKFLNKSIKEKSCSVCFDEMSIMTDLEYTKKYDMIEGFEDFGGGQRSIKEAKYALVFVARGLYINWKVPLAFFLSHNNVDSNRLSTLIQLVINKLFDSGLLPKVIVCDQATTNVKSIKSLGASVDQPFIFINNRKLFTIYDPPHLIKSIRNNLINDNFELNGNEISFKDIITVYNIDKNNKSKSLKKLTPVHLNPNSFQKMKVKLATQVFSNSVAAAIETAISSGELNSNTAKHTADFVRLVNDLFDSLNSKNKFDKNPFRCAITKNSLTIVNQTLIKGREVFNKLRKIKYNKNNKKQMTIPPCFDGMQHTINAVIQLTTEEFSPGTGVKFLLTYRLNQDVIENLFGIYRIKGGCNKNPSARSLRSMFRSNLLNNLMNFDKTNCEKDKDMFLPSQQHTHCSNASSGSLNPNFLNPPHEPTPSPSSSAVPALPSTSSDNSIPIPSTSSSAVSAYASTSSDIPILTDDPSPQLPTLEICSVVYFAGWLAKTCVEKFDCQDCKQILNNNQVDLNDKKQLLLINKTYSNILIPTLKSPTEFLLILVNKLLDFFNENINQLFKLKLISNLIKDLKDKMNIPGDYHDYNHINYLINRLFEIKIYDYCKTKKKSIQSSAKIKILHHR